MAATSLLLGQEAIPAVLDQAREAFGAESAALMEGGHCAHGVPRERAARWTPVAVSGGWPPGWPDAAATEVPVTDSLCLALWGPALPAADCWSLRAFAALATAAHEQQRLAEAASEIAEADRTRTALLATVGHDLRTPLAAAKAAVNCLRSVGIQLTTEDHDELLATADESLDVLTHLVASLLDVSRLQAGALPIFPRPADLEEVITRSLSRVGPQAVVITTDIEPDLPEIMVDPAIMERVLVNLAANALQYSPAGSPPLLVAAARGDRVELRVTDHGPGVPPGSKDQIFMPFQRLGDTDITTGIGLGLALSRSLTEAMHGTLEARDTPGGGLTMAISLPAVPTSTQAHLSGRERETTDRPP